MDKLQEYRLRIDEIDEQMAELFEKRMRIVREVGIYKKEKGLPLSDPERERAIIESHQGKISPEDQEAYGRFMENLFTIAKDAEK